jgi:2-(1,2-epoxy-1,2-dihydrophenyl)acetyl-CoA isomerase
MTVAQPEVLLERRGGVAIITLSQPDRRNAFTQEMRESVAEMLAQLANEAAIRAIVITGAEGNFSAGADVSRVVHFEPGILPQRERTARVQQIIRAMRHGPKPIIAAVEGVAFGGGLAFAAAADVVVAARDARFSSAFTRIGYMPDMGLIHNLSERVGRSKARQLLLLGTVIGAEEAERLGLVDTLVAPGQALAEAVRVGESFEDLAPLAIACTRRALASDPSTLEETFRLELEWQPLLGESEDRQEAMNAFLEKRKPRFKGR